MYQKIRTVPTTSTSEGCRVKINNGNLYYSTNGSTWNKYNFPIEDNPNLKSDLISRLLKSLDLESTKAISTITKSPTIDDVEGSILNNLSLFCQLNRTDLRLNKQKLDTTDFPEAPINSFENMEYEIEIKDYEYLVKDFIKIISYAGNGILNHKLSNSSTIIIDDNCKAIKVNIIYQLKSDLNIVTDKPQFRTRELIFSPTREYTKLDELFSIELKDNNLTVLKSWEVSQLFIRSINFIV